MTTRRLAAILAADVVGFSSMMERDEEGTAARIRALRSLVIEPLLAKHHGRLIKTTGDGFLAEFASPVEAVRSALAVQNQLTAAEGDKGLRLRIGINLGDIIIEDDGDVFGEGVNIATRLEQLAKVGGICLSDEVHRHVAGKIDCSFDDKGEQQVKNISQPVRVYALTGAAHRRAEPKPLPLPDKPSIAVLPFTNMSGDPEQEYFADGMAEDIITALSRFQSLFVIARNSSFTYKGRAVDIKQVGRELGVRYVLEGSVRKAGNRLRITGQLIDTSTGNHLWADRFEGALEEVFDLQDQVTSEVVVAIVPTVEQAEIDRAKRKATQHLDGYDFLLRGMALLNQATLETNDGALAYFYKAIRADPEFATACGRAAACFMMRKSAYGVRLSEEERAEALRLAQKAIALGRHDAIALSTGGHILAYIGYDLECAPSAGQADC